MAKLNFDFFSSDILSRNQGKSRTNHRPLNWEGKLH